MHSRSYIFKLEVPAKLDELDWNISTTAKFFGIPLFCVHNWNEQRENFATITRWNVEVRKRCNIPLDNEQYKK